MKKIFFLIAAVACIKNAIAQTNNYSETIKAYQEKYVSSHDVVKAEDKQFISFYPVSPDYNVSARFEKNADTVKVAMKTSGTTIPVKNFTRWGKLYFSIHATELILNVYRSTDSLPAEYKDYLFIPFTDLTSGEGSYGGGRYIDILSTDIKGNFLQLDFNKAYNPYCAYTTGYNCPIPPRENYLAVVITAGEKDYGKKH